ncbi:MAG: pyridoxal phosphate-dependent aminotransferase, partial [Thermodesulfobacteriota bacterium]
MLSNFITDAKGRVDSHKDITLEEKDALVSLARAKLASDFETYHWNANIHGIIVRLNTNSAHLYDFWVENWFPSVRTQTVLPHGIIYAVCG